MKTLLALTSLLMSTALLLVGHGMQLTLLPLRGTLNGLSEFMIGMSASAYFLGFIAGCLVIPRIIAKVGHIRSFAVLTAIMISALLALEIFSAWPAWLLLRFITGAIICGLYTVIESWLNDQARPEIRGRVLAVYTFIILTSMAGGQFLITVGPTSSSLPFMLAVIFMALAIVPVGLTSRLAPAPVESTRARFRLLYRRSRSAFAGTILSGLVVGGFWALGAIFARRYSASLSDVTLFMTAAIAGGALFQYPIGWLSDRLDRRLVMLALSVLGGVAAAAVAFSVGKPWHLAAVFLFGAWVMPMYAISLAMAADNSDKAEFVEIGTSVLMLNAMAAATAPLLLGQVMTLSSPAALFWASAGLCALFAVYLAIECIRGAATPVDEQTPFSAASLETAPTGFVLDPRSEDEAVGDIRPATGMSADEARSEPGPESPGEEPAAADADAKSAGD